jgi:hypothetical protein
MPKSNWHHAQNKPSYKQLYSEEFAKRIELLEQQSQRIDMLSDSIHLVTQQAQAVIAEFRALKNALVREYEQARLTANDDSGEEAGRDTAQSEKSEE